MSDRQWYYISGGQQVGPIAEDELVTMFQKGQLGPDTQVWTAELKNWTRAKDVEALISPSLSPALVTEGSRVQPAQIRPTSVTVFGILNIIWGAMGLLVWRNLIISSMNGGMISYISIFVIFIGIVISVLFIVTGGGLLTLKKWARVWTLRFGWFAIFLVILGTIVKVLLNISMFPKLIGGVIIVESCKGIVTLIYPVLLVIFMRKENVIHAFKR